MTSDPPAKFGAVNVIVQSVILMLLKVPNVPSVGNESGHRSSANLPIDIIGDGVGCRRDRKKTCCQRGQ